MQLASHIDSLRLLWTGMPGILVVDFLRQLSYLDHRLDGGPMQSSGALVVGSLRH